jgi:hypothetical protein
MRSLLRSFLVAAALASSFPSALRAAGPTPDEHANTGAALLAKKKFADAVTQYLLAYVADPRPERLADLARVYEMSKAKEPAIELYERILTIAPGTGPAAIAQDRLVALGAIAPVSNATLALTVIPAGADVSIDGSSRGKAPVAAMPLAPGVHQLTLSLPGYQTFTQDLTAGSGQSMSVVVTLVPASTAAVVTAPVTPPVAPLPTNPLPLATSTVGNGSLVGSWVAHRYGNVERDKQTLVFTLAGSGATLTGTATMTVTTALASYRKAQCNNATQITATTKFKVRLIGAGSPSAHLIVEDEVLAACSCEGLCSAAGSHDYPVMVSPRGTVLASTDYFFQKYDGATPPADLSRPLDAAKLAGKWALTINGVPGVGSATLGGSAGNLTGSLSMSRSTPVQSFRRAECNGADTVTATHLYTVEGTAAGNTVEMEFSHEKYENCTCGEGACASASAAVKIGSETSFWTLDGNHFVSPKFLFVRQ